MADVILVHGAWHGAWCWDQVAAGLEALGHRVKAIDLPGHTEPGRRSRMWNRASQYVDAVADAVATSPTSPVVVGHSMGGYVVQRYLETGNASCGVLVASVPARGALMANLRAVRNHPAPALTSALTANYAHLVDTPSLTRALFFSDDTPDEIVTACHGRLQNESALVMHTMILRRPRPQKVSTPMAVIAASDDGVFTLAEQHKLALAYGVELEVIEGGHDLMLDTTWPLLVQAIDRTAQQY